MSRPGTIAVIGAGSWGTALAIQLARNGHRVPLWGRDAEQIAAMTATRENRRYLPGLRLADAIEPTRSLDAAVAAADAILMVVPSHGFRAQLRAIAAGIGAATPVFWATKGLEPGSRKLLHEIAREELGSERPLGVVSGPTFAAEVARGLPTAVTVAAFEPEHARLFADLLHCTTFRTYTHTDVIGVELGGACKNVLAIAAGIADGLGFGANTRAALITRGLAEMMRLGVAAGGLAETFMGLAGLGDLVLTCTDDQSRNRRAGLSLGGGHSLEQTVATIGQAVEGVKSAPEVARLAGELGVELPITEQVCRVITGAATPRDAVAALMSREQKSELA